MFQNGLQSFDVYIEEIGEVAVFIHYDPKGNSLTYWVEYEGVVAEAETLRDALAILCRLYTT